MTPKTNIFLILALITALAGCDKHLTPNQNENNYSGDVITQWNLIAFVAMGGTSYQHSLMASRINAMTHLAMHDAVNAASPVYERYAFRSKDTKADPVAVATSAASGVLTASFPEKKVELDAQLEQSQQAVKDGESEQRGIELGRKAANAVLANRQGDDADLHPIVKLEPVHKPGEYRAVPPADFIFAPHWKSMKLFSLDA